MKLKHQILFWFFTVIILIAVFIEPYGSLIHAFYFVVFLLPVIIGTSYAFNSYLIPNFLLRKKYSKFILYTVYALIISLDLEMLVIILAFVVLANYEYKQMLSASTNVFVLAIVMYFIVAIKAFILILKINFQKTDKLSSLSERQNNLVKGYLLVKSNRRNVKVLLEEILYIESLGDYVKIHLQDKPVVITKEKISKIGSRLDKPFIRIHRSFIVNANHVDHFTSESVRTSSGELPISRSYKKETLDFLKK